MVLVQEVRSLTEENLHSTLGHLQKLRSLSIVNCKSVYGYGALDHCHRLENLEIGNTVNLVDEDLFALCSLGNLRALR